jgi:hypothetical protein
MPLSCEIRSGITGIIRPQPMTSIKSVIKMKLMAAVFGGAINFFGHQRCRTTTT